MKMSANIIIRNFLLGGLFLFALSVLPLRAAPVVRSGSSSEPLILLNTIQQFLNDTGGTDNGAGGSFTGGWRQIDWDVVPDNHVLNNSLIASDYFNTTSPRGMVLSSACTGDQFKVSFANASNAQLRFGNINPAYSNSFKNFIGNRLFSADIGGCNVTDVYFYVPGTRIPATVKSFGAVFTDVDFSFKIGRAHV